MLLRSSRMAFFMRFNWDSPPYVIFFAAIWKAYVHEHIFFRFSILFNNVSKKVLYRYPSGTSFTQLHSIIFFHFSIRLSILTLQDENLTNTVIFRLFYGFSFLTWFLFRKLSSLNALSLNNAMQRKHLEAITLYKNIIFQKYEFRNKRDWVYEI